jgi:hypothetical protein
MIQINGKTYKGNNISMNNGKILIDGKAVEGHEDEKVINVTVNGNINSLAIDDCEEIKITGECGAVTSKNGNIVVKGNVTGDAISKNGNIVCSNVGGSAETKNGNIVHS